MSTGRPWVVVLAGGEGLRLRSITIDEEGRHVPKQFCSFGGEGSLLTHAVDRARAITAHDRVLVVVREVHRRWWEPALQGLPQVNVVVQSDNRGTGVAVASAIEHVLERDRDPTFVFLPSDHGIDDEGAWHRALRRIAEAAARWPAEIVLLGMEVPFDADLGWLVPGAASPDGTRLVLRFVEKPAASEMARAHDGLCSTFVFAASARALLMLYERHAPHLIPGRGRALGSRGEPGTKEAAAGFPVLDFSHDLLERAPRSLRVLKGPACGWTDLGTPLRLQRWCVRRRRGRHGARVEMVARSSLVG